MSAALQITPPAVPVPSSVEHSTAMMQQMAQAQIQSAYIWAERHPRDWDVIEMQLVKECSRPRFVAIDPDPKKYGSSAAMYGVPRGGEYVDGRWTPNIVDGFTIRFAEMALPYLKNISVDLFPIGEDDSQVFYRVLRMDFESNTPEGRIITVPKTIERRRTKEGDIVVGTRTNSKGDAVYIIRATAEEIETKKAALYSKAKRDLVVNILPAWLKDTCKEKIRATQRTEDAQDPDAARKRLYAGFAKLNVPIEELKSYIGHTNDLNPAELEELRLIYGAIAEGHTTWREVVAAKNEGTDDGSAAKLDALFKQLEYTPAQIRNAKAKYAGHPEKLVEWLDGQVAKKANDGGKQEEKVPDGGTYATGTGPAPGPEKQETKPKAEPAKPKAKPAPVDANW